MNLTTLFKSHLEEQIYGQRQGVEEGEGEMIGEKSMEAYTLPYVKNQWEFALWLRELKLGLSNDAEGWARVGGGKDIQEEGDMCTPMASSC